MKICECPSLNCFGSEQKNRKFWTLIRHSPDKPLKLLVLESKDVDDVDKYGPEQLIIEFDINHCPVCGEKNV